MGAKKFFGGIVWTAGAVVLTYAFMHWRLWVTALQGLAICVAVIWIAVLPVLLRDKVNSRAPLSSNDAAQMLGRIQTDLRRYVMQTYGSEVAARFAQDGWFGREAQLATQFQRPEGK